MVDNPESNGKREPNKPAHLGLYWIDDRPQLGRWNDDGVLRPYKAVVQIQDQSYRFDSDISYILVVSGSGETCKIDPSGIKFL